MDEKIVIKKLITGGKGLGWQADGMAVMATGALPGETLCIHSGQMRKGYLEAREFTILEPAPQRITPACPHYQEGCGGCDLQHARYAAQLEYKQNILHECLQRAGLDMTKAHVATIPPAVKPFGYRHRLRFHLDEEGRLGFFRHNSRLLVPVQHCLLAPDRINQALVALQESGWTKRWKRKLGQIELIQSPASGEVLLLPHPHPKANNSPAEDQKILDDLQSLSVGRLHALPLRRGQVGRDLQKDQPVLRQDFLFLHGTQKYQLRWDATCFFQANAYQSPHLVDLAIKMMMATDAAPATVLELFCGMGTFSVPLGLAGLRLTGLEHNRQSVFFAEENCRNAGVEQSCCFYSGDVDTGLRRLISKGEKFDAMLFDPPRLGLGKAVELLPKLNLKRIVAISCDPATLARDLRAFVQQGFGLSAVHGVDMFPQTHHIESLALLERN